MNQIEAILKETKWIGKTAQESWLDKKVTNPATGKTVKVKSLPPEERKKHKPSDNELNKHHIDQHFDRRDLKNKIKSLKKDKRLIGLNEDEDKELKGLENKWKLHLEAPKTKEERDKKKEFKNKQIQDELQKSKGKQQNFDSAIKEKGKDVLKTDHQSKFDALKNSLTDSNSTHQHVYIPSETTSKGSTSHSHSFDDGAPVMKYFDRTGKDWEGSKSGKKDSLKFEKDKHYHVMMDEKHAYVPDHENEGKWHRINKKNFDSNEHKKLDDLK